MLVSSKLIINKGECQVGQQAKFINKIGFAIPIQIMVINFMAIAINIILLVIRLYFVE